MPSTLQRQHSGKQDVTLHSYQNINYNHGTPGNPFSSIVLTVTQVPIYPAEDDISQSTTGAPRTFSFNVADEQLEPSNHLD